MTATDFKRWRRRRAQYQHQAARDLGLSRTMVGNYERGEYPIPRVVALACAALAAGLNEYRLPVAKP